MALAPGAQLGSHQIIGGSAPAGAAQAGIAPTGHIQVVPNWFEDLKRRVPVQ